MTKKVDKRGLLLEGGAARGAYHAGAYRALRKHGRRYQLIVGVSVGAINGASFLLYPNGRKTWAIWKNLTTEFSNYFDIHDEEKLNGFNLFRTLARGGRIPTETLRYFIEKYICEESLRRSNIDYGLSTLAPGELKTLHLFKNDIPQGELVDYILASAALPFFKIEKVGNRLLFDGGLVESLPIKMLVDRNCSHIDIIRTVPSKPRKRKIPAEVEVFRPSAALHSQFDFRGRSILNSLQMGYFDTMRVLHCWQGSYYYLNCAAEWQNFFFNLSLPTMTAAVQLFQLPFSAPRRQFFSLLLPHLFRLCGLPEDSDYLDLLIFLLEQGGQYYHLPRFRLYSVSLLMKIVNDIMRGQPPPRPPAISTSASLLLLSRSRCGYYLYLLWSFINNSS